MHDNNSQRKVTSGVRFWMLSVVSGFSLAIATSVLMKEYRYLSDTTDQTESIWLIAAKWIFLPAFAYVFVATLEYSRLLDAIDGVKKPRWHYNTAIGIFYVLAALLLESAARLNA